MKKIVISMALILFVSATLAGENNQNNKITNDKISGNIENQGNDKRKKA
jgi:hypothetical protein